ncbi:MAG: hypothetical protein A2Z99_11715 [Treponema sp. GWB1_62_6]|nr:MAG: hypothetical protein A2Y36_11340 [Treponema sp. GWA1_62_8]OHE66487.1 MAG: hypothetical protein A2Z99_11715 [Treponema sp. GWB1_62_6]OHE69241.1 MAG: hypothetical protein A2001_13665 [Treponema sp. GWC1_61_84]HCM27132.1 hypothetical protein [Treponema sp.]
MAKRIQFEDDIFYISLIVRNLCDCLALDLDPDLFLERTVNEISFVERALDRMSIELIANDRLIERNEQLQNLAEAEARFADLLMALSSGEGRIQSALLPFADRLVQWLDDSRRRSLEIDGATTGTGPAENDPAVVSSLELNELLRGLE